MGDRHDTQWLFSAGELEQTPSVKLGMSVQNERTLRQKSILFILEMARYLSCNHLVISSASIMFHRFMVCQAFQNHDRFIVCATCIFLAGKAEEQPKRLKDVVDVFLLIRSKVQSKFIESELKLIHDKILVAERILLQTLAFDLQIDHPYGYCMHLLKSHKASFTSELARGETNDDTRRELQEEVRKEVKRLAMNFLTDSFRGVLCLEFSAEVIATAVTLLAVLAHDLPPPIMAGKGGVLRKSPGEVKSSTWTDLFLSASKGNVSEIDLKTCCSRVIEVYEDKVIAIAGAEDAGVKENNALRVKLQTESSRHADWLQLPVAEPEVEMETTDPKALQAMKCVEPAVRIPPPPPPPKPTVAGVQFAGSRPAPPPPPARPSQRLFPPHRAVLVSVAPAPIVQGFAPATPDVLPPPTPDYFPPPTPIDDAPAQCMQSNNPNGMGNANINREDCESTEPLKKRRADDRLFSGSSDNGQGDANSYHASVRQSSENGDVINGRNDDGSSPPKKHKL